MVARLIGIAALSLAADAARMKNTEVISVETVAENWVEHNETSNPICDSLWTKELDKSFKNKRVWGSGATACVFGGEDESGTTVAIKVGKPTESIAGWRAECGEMQMMRMKACKDGADSMKLHEEYIPTCTMVAQTPDKKSNYYSMHAGGTIAYRNLPKEPLDLGQKKYIFAQLVASIYALHKIDFTHNDLHGQNIVLNQEYKLALIDFGSLKTIANANVEGYKRDSNAIWRWGAVVFDCGESSEWKPDLPNVKISKAERKSRAANFKKCLANNGASAGTLAAIQKMTDSCIAQDVEQHVAQLYNTDFVQSALRPTKKRHFPYSKVAGCLKWDDATYQNHMYAVEFGNHFTCNTTPGWITSRKKKNGKIRKSAQCGVAELQSACFSTKKAVRASCGGGLDMRMPCENIPDGTGGTFSGACLKANHPAYKVAQPWK